MAATTREEAMKAVEAIFERYVDHGEALYTLPFCCYISVLYN
jgi:hypothetical protein